MDDILIYGVEISGGVILASLFLGLIASVGTCKLFAKADLPCWHVFVPFLNIMTAMKLIGRPTWHAWLFFTPAIVYLVPKTIIELAQSYGKHTTTDYVLALVFNVFYVLNLGLSYDEVYEGPSYQKKDLVNKNLNVA
jgi:signal peptidase I